MGISSLLSIGRRLTSHGKMIVFSEKIVIIESVKRFLRI